MTSSNILVLQCIKIQSQNVLLIYLQKQTMIVSVVYEAIRNLSKQLKTNFGMQFDWETGKQYSVEDPRRK